ncbi:MAG: fumarylacetoacetase [Bacteroidetes bacterium]|nr:fumarylacetoacetase [Bacteroidota bacterium]HET6245107.1 fumarylacetoacetase [Bacteroidia bacterium]
MNDLSNPNLVSWINVEKDSDFPIQNLPFGIFKTSQTAPHLASIIGEFVIDLALLSRLGYFEAFKIDQSIFANNSLNDFIGLGKPLTNAIRTRISELLREENPELRENSEHREKIFHKVSEVQMLLPVEIGDYTDFYSSIEHATNVGTMFRDPENALLPNWKHIPVGYHGRSSSIVVSGIDIHRPKGQTKADDAENPVFGPTKLLDFELEMAFIIGKQTEMGDTVSTDDAEKHIFGMVLFNDWSARDIQKWEYVPLGPFLAKNFASSCSPWVVTMEALEPFRIKGPEQKPEVLPYLQYQGEKNIDIHLEVLIQPEKSTSHTVCRSNFKYMYWNMNQQLAHHTVNGCNIRIGDLMASGTISGPSSDSYGSMLELSWKGTKAIPMADGTERRFILDMDTVIMRGYAQKDRLRIGFGEVKTKILPTR